MPRPNLLSFNAYLIAPGSPYLSYYSDGGYYFIPYENVYANPRTAVPNANYATPSDTLPDGAVWIGQFIATDEPKEIAVPEGVYRQIRFELIAGTAGLNTVWLLPEEAEVQIYSNLKPGEIFTIDFQNAPRVIDGLWIDDFGQGVYRIYGL